MTTYLRIEFYVTRTTAAISAKVTFLRCAACRGSETFHENTKPKRHMPNEFIPIADVTQISDDFAR